MICAFWWFMKSMTLDPWPPHNIIIKSCLSWISDQHGYSINMEFLSIKRSFHLINEMRALVKSEEQRLFIQHMNKDLAIS